MDVQPDEIIDVLANLLAEAEVLMQAHKAYESLTDADLEPLDQVAIQLAGTLRTLAEVAVGDAIAHKLLPAYAADDLAHFQHVDSVKFAFECREAAASCEAYGIYDPVEAIGKAREAGLLWLAGAGGRVLAQDRETAANALLLHEARKKKEFAERVRLEMIQKTQAKNMARAQEAQDRQKRVAAILGAYEHGPRRFITSKQPGWQAMAEVYGLKTGAAQKIPPTVGKQMGRDWQAILDERILLPG
jgi:hypothetical protein